MTDSAFEWSVGKLQELNFDGDADALAAYVNALIENNRDAEGGEPELLRSRARQELEDFLGAPDAAAFVNGLMRHLSTSAQAEQAVPIPISGRTSDAANTDHLPDQAHGPQAVASASNGPVVTSESLAGEQPAHELNQVSPKSAMPISINNQREVATDDGKVRGVRSPRAIPVDGEKRSRSAFNRSITTAQENRGAQSKSMDIPSSDGSGQIDLRSQLSRSRAPSTKRPRDGEVRDGNGGDWDGDNGRNWGRGREQDRGRAHTRDNEYQRVGDRDRLHVTDASEANKYPRRTGPGGVLGSDGRTPIRDMTIHGAEVRTSADHHAGHGPPGFLSGTVGQVPQPLGYLPPPPPGFMQHMREMIQNGGPPPPHAFPPRVPGMVPPPQGVVPPGAILPFMHTGRGGAVGLGGRGRGRGMPIGVSGRQSQQGVPQPRGRALASVLILRNVPHDKLTLGAINEYFEKFGTVSNIQLRPAHKPDHAFIEFAHRMQAQSAYDCVDAVMGNRHVRLFWARESDFEQDGIPLSGVELAPVGQTRKQPFNNLQEGTPQLVMPSSSHVAEEDPAIVLQRKRKEIAAAREEQQKIKTERQVEYTNCIAEQKLLFSKLEAGCSDEEKKELLKRIKSLGKDAEAILAAVKAKETSVKPNDVPESLKGGPPVLPGRGSGRVRGPMSADFRPKVVRITGASVDGLSEAVAKSIFHETVSATLVDRTWVLDFATRRAAESATKAIGVLKKRFGPSSVMSLSDSRPAVLPMSDEGEVISGPVEDVAAPGGDDGGKSGPVLNGTDGGSVSPSLDTDPVLTPTATAGDAAE